MVVTSAFVLSLESSNVISVVKKQNPVKNHIYLKMYEKPEKVMFAIILMESAWLCILQDCICFFCFGEEYIYWPSGCLNWCLAEHSPVKNAETTACLSSPDPPTVTLNLRVPVTLHRYLQGCLQCLHFFLCDKIQNPYPPFPFHPFHPPPCQEFV